MRINPLFMRLWRIGPKKACYKNKKLRYCNAERRSRNQEVTPHPHDKQNVGPRSRPRLVKTPVAVHPLPSERAVESPTFSSGRKVLRYEADEGSLGFQPAPQNVCQKNKKLRYCNAEVRVICVPLRLLLFRINTHVNAHRVKSRGGGLRCAHLRATQLLTSLGGSFGAFKPQRGALS